MTAVLSPSVQEMLRDVKTNVLLHKMCEDCGKVHATYGMQDEKTKRWCGGCGKGHEGAMSLLLHKMCEDCSKVQPSFRLPGEKTKRWCASCGKGHGAVNSRQRTKRAKVGSE